MSATVSRRIAALLIVICISMSIGSAAASANVPYHSYTYSYWSEPQVSPAPYLPSRIVDGHGSGSGAWRSPQDLFIDHAGKVYIADTGNNRIVILDEQLELDRIVAEVNSEAGVLTFNQPSGVYADKAGLLYIADTGNQRVLIVGEDNDVLSIIKAPQSEIIRDGFVFQPTKVSVDNAKRIYVISKGVFDGIMEFDDNGQFNGFVGTNPVSFDFADWVWKKLATQKQRDQMLLFIPMEFNNIDMDAQGFIYATTRELNTSTPVKRLNPAGVDVLRREGYHQPKGDIEHVLTGSIQGSSMMEDVAVHEAGIYTLLDSKRGRLFTYDFDGNLLFVYGALGEQKGTFRSPTSVAERDNDIFVLDQGLNQLTVFTQTAYGEHVLSAVIAHKEGNDEEAVSNWKSALKYNSNLEMAYIGIGKAMLAQEQYKEAAKYFKLGNHRSLYSSAYGYYRQEVLKQYFSYILFGGVAVVILWMLLPRLRKRRRAAA